jgi:hypothetical protein
MPQPINRFLDGYQSPSTRNTYRSGLSRFFHFIYDQGDVNQLTSRYLGETRHYETDIENFATAINTLTSKTWNL